MENESDERLVERFQTGERAAFDEIARRYRPRLLRFLRLRTRSLEAAEDLTQETLMKAFASLENLRRGAFFSGWLHRVAYRAFVDSTRRRRLNVASFDENDDAAESVFAPRTPLRPSGTEFEGEAPETPIVRLDAAENVWRVARQILTDKEFKALWLRYVDDASDREAAVALGVSSGAVRVALTRARQKLIAYFKTRERLDESRGANVETKDDSVKNDGRKNEARGKEGEVE